MSFTLIVCKNPGKYWILSKITVATSSKSIQRYDMYRAVLSIPTYGTLRYRAIPSTNPLSVRYVPSVPVLYRTGRY
ncbi:hypothetical protein BHM03_00027155 [Ensete ventricosum]|nr:hypothetical protein BHM03_00027155 [Ensete ventricosum]